MIEFDESFFLGETRNDFYIEPMMKRAWAAQMEVLQVVQQICVKYGLRYFVSDGTLLGAVRHQGYIPWDDDLDICMLREDYNQFLSLAPAELVAPYHIVSPYTSNEFDMTFSRINNSKAIEYSVQRLAAFHGFPYIAGIDILPLDTIPEDKDEREAFFLLYSTIMTCCMKYKEESFEVTNMLGDIEELCHTKINRSGNILNQLCRLGDTLSQAYRGDSSPYVSRMAFYNEEKTLLRREWYADCVWLPFENISVPAPSGYDHILTAIYGDYMTPVRGVASHEYPFYKKQRKVMVETIASRIYHGEDPLLGSKAIEKGD